MTRFSNASVTRRPGVLSALPLALLLVTGSAWPPRPAHRRKPLRLPRPAPPAK